MAPDISGAEVPRLSLSSSSARLVLPRSPRPPAPSGDVFWLDVGWLGVSAADACHCLHATTRRPISLSVTPLSSPFPPRGFRCSRFGWRFAVGFLPPAGFRPRWHAALSASLPHPHMMAIALAYYEARLLILAGFDCDEPRRVILHGTL